ncbi:T9SS type A sorting domain-containing protein [candidate division TA06 bacterium]|nr:T9SS type A sorting domain-containing protein [candidate division TA06 bacterium]
MMKQKSFLFMGSVTLFLMITPSISQGVSINWGAANYPLYDQGGVGGTVLPRGSTVHLIWDQDMDGIDPPGSDGMPGQGDVLIGTSWIGHGSFFEGEFSQNTDAPIVRTGDVIYVRAWNDSLLTLATYFGDTRDHNATTWTIDNDLAFTLDCTWNNAWATLYPSGNPTGIEKGRSDFGFRISEIGLQKNYPNPFTLKTTIQYGLSEPDFVRLTIYDITGRPLRVLVDKRQEPGQYEIFWDGRNDEGSRIGSGVYFTRLTLGFGKSFTEKITLLKNQ